jgi:hypothetical protein
MVFNFPSKCLTAIQLDNLSHELPCILAFEEEGEILILHIELHSLWPKLKTILHLEHLNLDKETDDFLTYKMDALFG